MANEHLGASANGVLYRPVGYEEFKLIRESGFRRFPTRLAEQPFFYPVLTEDYAIKIARDWNTREPSGLGYVTRFSVKREFLDRYTIQTAGGKSHREYWIPAADLEDFNDNIVGKIEIIRKFSRG
jgi:hypothetical protein